MPTFVWTGRDPQGRVVQGTLKARNEDVVRAMVERDGTRVIAVEKKKSPLEMELNLSFLERVSDRDIAIFARQLAAMINAGVPIVQALAIYAEQAPKKKLRDVIDEIRKKVESGEQLYAAMEPHKNLFGPLFVSMVRVGEAGGILGDTLNSLAEYLEKMDNLKAKIKSAMTYPTVVMVVAIVVVIGLMTFVVPKFVSMFQESNVELPMITRMVMAVSEFMTSKGMVFLSAGVIGGLIALQRFIKTERGRLIWDRLLFRAPVLGDVIQKGSIARFSRTLGMLLRGGVPILQALEITASSAGNKVIERAVMRARAEIGEGRSIAGPLRASGVFPPMVLHMVSIGEETGQLSEMLAKVSDFYDEEVDRAVERLTSMMEPLMIVFIGGIVMVILLSIYLPIFKMAQVVSG